MRSLERSALWQLTWTRTLAFLREPDAVVWVFVFPVLMALALGIAFRNPGPQPASVGIEAGPGAGDVARALRASPDLTAQVMAPAEAQAALRRGKIAVLVRPVAGGTPVLMYDPARPETRLAELLTADALQRAAGRADPVALRRDTRSRLGGRYIDFLLPGLIGLNLMSTGLWGIGFPIVNARQLKLLKRLVASPMRRSDYLLSLILARLLWLVLEVAVILGFGWLAFGVTVRGSWPAFAAVTLIATLSFSALGLLVGCRARTIEAVSGLMNIAMMPMWLLSGSFFSAERFPAVMQPLIKALPLTATNDALRAIMNEGSGLATSVPQLAVLAAWGVACFALALRWFRWE